jgi:uncharacterized protein YjbJ (UPF0337 family)
VKKGVFMNWDEIGVKWMQFKGSAKQKWGKLTDDDLDYVAGTRDRLIGRLQRSMESLRTRQSGKRRNGLKPIKIPRLDEI